MKKNIRILVGGTDEIINDLDLKVIDLAKKLEPDGDSFLFVLDEDHPLGHEVEVAVLVEKGHRELVHSKCHRIKVAVTFNGVEKDHSFAPSAKVGRVKRWFCQAFGIDEAAIPDMGLFLPGKQDALDEHRPIQAYLEHGHCELKLELARKEGWQG